MVTLERGLDQRPELRRSNFGIFDESHPLKSAVIWGAVGAETVLAQMLPEERSLFFQSFDVPAAREESANFSSVLQGFGVTVLAARNYLASRPIPADLKRGLSRQAVVSKIISKAKALRLVFGGSRSGEEDLIVDLVEQDIKQYGQEQALALNDSLCNQPRIPMGNVLYARDQTNVLLGRRVVCAMAKEIRRPEIDLYERMYGAYLTEHEPIRIPAGETFEGGDAYVHQGHVWVGVGARTTLGAALKIYEELKPDLDEHNFRFAVVQDDDPFARPFSEQQDFMHLDTFSNPTGKKDIAVCLEEASRRRVKLVSSVGGRIVITDTGLSFMDYLEHAVKEDEVTVVSGDEQKEFGCNFLLLGEYNDGRTVILAPLDSNTLINSQLRKRGKKVVTVDLYQSTRGYGAAHCMTAQLLREAA